MSTFTLTTSLLPDTYLVTESRPFDLLIFLWVNERQPRAFSLNVFRSNACVREKTVLIAALFFRSNFESTVECLALCNYETFITILQISSEDAAPSLYSKISCHIQYKSKRFKKCEVFLGYIKKLQNTVFDNPSDIHFVFCLNFQKTVHFFKSINLNALNLCALKLKN